ncbi:DHS-like NAD/FAD-binding domain-containing protein [Trametes elegans]|nr:DHS-like NAD/FAD-binding domain-containing protein [Trametes elegans]
MDDSDELLMLFDGPTKVLQSRDIAGVAKYMKSEQCQRVFVLVLLPYRLGTLTASYGAGVPDFRSPKKGLHSNTMSKLNLPYPRAVFELNYFRFNPVPLYTVARELWLGRFRPTTTHLFVKLLADGGTLQTCITENIDALEREAGIPTEHLVEAHGTFTNQRCVDCRERLDGAKMREAIERGEVARCELCSGLVRPDVLFFGEPLPQSLARTTPQLSSADLLFVIGTSLTAPSVAALATIVPETCPRVLINMDFAGDIGMRADDVLLLGKCDDVVRDLVKELGWEEALEREWAKTRETDSTGDPADAQRGRKQEHHHAAGAGIHGSPRDEDCGMQVDGAGHGDWEQESKPDSESLTERLRTAIEQSEKPSAHAPDPGIAFVARSLSGEELFTDANGELITRAGEVYVAEGIM